MVSMVIALAAGAVALIFAAIMAKRVLAADAGNEAMREIGDAIRVGSSAFLRREYLALESSLTWLPWAARYPKPLFPTWPAQFAPPRLGWSE